MQAQSNSTLLTVTVAELAAALNGHALINAYSLEVDSGHFSDFREVQPPSMKLTYVFPAERGTIYRLRYRASNGVGWGPYSPISSVLAAQPPEAPPAPKHYSSTSTAVTLDIFETEDDGGARVTSYELWLSSDFQAASPTWTQVTGYTGASMSYTLVVGTDPITTGTTYAFRTVARNIKGPSEPSLELIASVAAPLAKPGTPTRNLALSSRTHQLIEWPSATPSEISLSGYLLYMSAGFAGNWVLAYNGTSNANQRFFNVTGVTPGVRYSFKVVAVDDNGESPASDPLVVYACEAPGSPDAPVRTGGTATRITLSWKPPSDTGGCPLTQFKLMRDSGGGLTTPIATEVDAATFLNAPALTEHTPDLTALSGMLVRFQLLAFNSEGSSISPVA